MIVLDSGATRSVGSIQAMETLADLVGASQFKVDVNKRPHFKLGNGTTRQASNTAYMQLKDHKQPVEIAVMETDCYIPILGSFNLMRSQRPK